MLRQYRYKVKSREGQLRHNNNNIVNNNNKHTVIISIMLSPDVPEFVPRRYQTFSDSSGQDNVRSATREGDGWVDHQPDYHTVWEAHHTPPITHHVQLTSDTHTGRKKDVARNSPDNAATKGKERINSPGKAEAKGKSRLDYSKPEPAEYPTRSAASCSFSSTGIDSSNWRDSTDGHSTPADVISRQSHFLNKQKDGNDNHMAESEKHQQGTPKKGKAKKFNYVSTDDYFTSNTGSMMSLKSGNDDGVSYRKVLKRNQSDSVAWNLKQSAISSTARKLPMTLDEQWPTLGGSGNPVITASGWGNNQEDPVMRKTQQYGENFGEDTLVRKHSQNTWEDSSGQEDRKVGTWWNDSGNGKKGKIVHTNAREDTAVRKQQNTHTWFDSSEKGEKKIPTNASRKGKKKVPTDIWIAQNSSNQTVTNVTNAGGVRKVSTSTASEGRESASAFAHKRRETAACIGGEQNTKHSDLATNGKRERKQNASATDDKIIEDTSDTGKERDSKESASAVAEDRATTLGEKCDPFEWQVKLTRKKQARVKEEIQQHGSNSSPRLERNKLSDGWDRGRGGVDRSRGSADRGRGCVDRGRGGADRGRGGADRGRGIADRGRGGADRGRGGADRGRGGADRGRGGPDRGRVGADRGRGGADRGRGSADRGRGGVDRGRVGVDRGRGGVDRGRGGADRGRVGVDRGRGSVDRGREGINRGRGVADRVPGNTGLNIPSSWNGKGGVGSVTRDKVNHVARDNTAGDGKVRHIVTRDSIGSEGCNITRDRSKYTRDDFAGRSGDWSSIRRDNAARNSDTDQITPSLSRQLKGKAVDESDNLPQRRGRQEGTPPCSSDKPQEPLDPKIAQKKLEAKQRKKEEKMRKREESIKQSQRMQNRDSKVTFVTRDFLEKSQNYSANASSTRSSSYNVSSYNDYPSLFGSQNFTSSRSMRSNAVLVSRQLVEEELFDSEEHDLSYVTQSADDARHTTDAIKSENSSTFNARMMSSANGPSPVSHKVLASEMNQPGTTNTAPMSTGNGMSYSKTLQAPKKVCPTNPQPTTTVRKANPAVPVLNPNLSLTPQKKKVRTRDLIEFDLMAVALHKQEQQQLQKNRKKALSSHSKEETRKGKKAGATTTTTALSHTAKFQMKGAIVLKRGMQNEKKKKVITSLRKRMRKMNEEKLKALSVILQEAIATQEKLETVKSESVTGGPLPSQVLPSVAEEGKEEEAKKLEKSDEEEKKVHDKGEDEGDENIYTQIQKEDNYDEGRGNGEEDGTHKQKLIPSGRHETPKESRKETEICVNWNIGKMEKNTENLKDKASKPENTTEECKGKKTILEGVGEKIQPQLPISEDANDTSTSDSSQQFERAKFLITQEIKNSLNPLHTVQFREYCDHIITKELNQTAECLVKTIVGFQQQHYARDPAKALIRRRYVCGLRQANKLMHKLSCVILAPNIDHFPGPGGLDERVEKLLRLAETHSIPVIFALTCKQLGILCHKYQGVSCFAIISYQGAEELYFKLMSMVERARKEYRNVGERGRKLFLDKHKHRHHDPPLQEVPEEEKQTAATATTKLRRPDYQTILLSALHNTPYLKEGAESPPDSEENSLDSNSNLHVQVVGERKKGNQQPRSGRKLRL
ncbi:hypothetical protein Pcinc_011851 [Petrolisthes cinctipes]|uniref:Ribosomal protein eL8/eL30/eS12/Gadd45 domain-containing protein n=1 Tax=Petrolisthes cinctipes TaxID=88211 RepID=A0AAE1KT35_PETCI|nr:hypothetical protein Pcinc_011851 [Petrolisthes cinctipes]